jgi:hypothetical protein
MNSTFGKNFTVADGLRAFRGRVLVGFPLALHPSYGQQVFHA